MAQVTVAKREYLWSCLQCESRRPQVGAHGTGATVPPVDEQVVGMKLVTQNLGTLELSNEKHPSLFRMAKVGTRTETHNAFRLQQWLDILRVD